MGESNKKKAGRLLDGRTWDDMLTFLGIIGVWVQIPISPNHRARDDSVYFIKNEVVNNLRMLCTSVADC